MGRVVARGWRKRALVGVILTVLAPSHAVVARGAEGEPAAKLVVPIATQELGEVAKGSTVTATFELRNEGTATLNVIEVIPITAGLEIVRAPQSIAPGQAGAVEVRKILYRELGLFHLDLAVRTDARGESTVRLSARCEIKEFVSVRPGSARWITVQGEPAGTIRQTLRSSDGRPFEILGVDVAQPGLQVSVKELGTEVDRAPGSAWAVDLTLANDAPAGPVKGEVRVRVDHPRQPVVRIPVSGFMRPVIAVTPTHLLFGEVTVAKEERQPLLVRNFASEQIQVVGVDHDLPGVPEAELITDESGRRYTVVLSFGPEVPKGPLRGTVTIRTDSPKVPTVVVEVEGTIR